MTFFFFEIDFTEESDEDGSGQEIHDDDDEDLHDHSSRGNDGSGEIEPGKYLICFFCLHGGMKTSILLLGILLMSGAGVDGNTPFQVNPGNSINSHTSIGEVKS